MNNNLHYTKSRQQKRLERFLLTLLTVFLLGVVLGASVTYGVCNSNNRQEELTEKPVCASATETVIEEQPEPDLKNLGDFRLTAYCPCEKCCGKWATTRPLDENGKPIVYTASGAIAKSNKTIAVDPKVIPYGTKVIIDGCEYIAEDCGGAIKGNRIDVYFDTHEQACNFGVQNKSVYVY